LNTCHKSPTLGIFSINLVSDLARPEFKPQFGLFR